MIQVRLVSDKEELDFRIYVEFEIVPGKVIAKRFRLWPLIYMGS